MTIETKQHIESEIHANAAPLVPNEFMLVVSLVKKQGVKTDIVRALQIQSLVCSYLNIDLALLFEKTRKGEIVKARKYICYFLKRYTTLSLRLIAEKAGVSDHSCVKHHIADLEDLLFSCEKTNEDVAVLIRQIETNVTA
jgi:chromosomal replication initiation ATPase DnaA